MLEKYREGMTAEKAVRETMEAYGLKTGDAVSYLRKHVPKEAYFQKKIKAALRKEYPEAFVVKIAQGAFSEAGIPDIMFVYKGHYFGFEVKRPVFGRLSALQAEAIMRINAAGGTALAVTYPEEALKAVSDWIGGN